MLSSWFRGSRPNVVLRGSALDEDGLVVLLCRWLVQTRPSLPELQADDGSCFNPHGDEENLFKVSGGIEQTVELHRHELSKGGSILVDVPPMHSQYEQRASGSFRQHGPAFPNYKRAIRRKLAVVMQKKAIPLSARTTLPLSR